MRKFIMKKILLPSILFSVFNSCSMMYDPTVEYKEHTLEGPITRIACTICFGQEEKDRYEGEVCFNRTKNKYGGQYKNNGHGLGEWSLQFLGRERAQTFYEFLSEIIAKKKIRGLI